MKQFTTNLKPTDAKERILLVQNDMDHYNREIAAIDQKIKQLTTKKATIAVKISKKQQYKTILMQAWYETDKMLEIFKENK